MIAPIMPVYDRFPLTLEKAQGVYVYASDGRRFLDFGTGVAVNSLGHCHPHVVSALEKQANTVWHISNLFHNPVQTKFADRLIQNTFADTVFFCNSGTEAIEGSIKFARRYFFAKGQPERSTIITFTGAFHGRTLAALAAGGQAKYLEGFGAKAGGFVQVDPFDVDALKQAITPETCAILIEPIQGEGGVRSMMPEFLKTVRQICDEHGLLMIMDEIQTGMGRTGKLFAHEHVGITPDIMAVAKGIGAGFPLGAVLLTEDAASGMTFGTHGTTYGGNPLAMAVGNAVLDIILEKDFLAQVTNCGELFKQGLHTFKSLFPDIIEDIRGQGLLVGLKLKPDVTPRMMADSLQSQGVLSIPAGDNVLRLLPPLIVTADQIEEGLGLLGASLREIRSQISLKTAS